MSMMMCLKRAPFTLLADTYVRIAAMCCTHVSAPLSPGGGGGGGARIRAGGINPCMGGGGAPEVDAKVEVRIYKER